VFLSQDDWLSACGSGEEKEAEEEEEEEEEEKVLGAGMPADLILKLQAMRASRSAHLVREEEEGGEDEEGEGGCREQWEDVDHLKSGRKVSGTLLGRGRGGGGEGEGGIQQVQRRIPQNQERERGEGGGGEAHTNLRTRTEGESEGARMILRGRGYVDELEGVLRSRAAVPRHFCYVPL